MLPTPPFEIHVGEGVPRARMALGGRLGTPVDGILVLPVAGEPTLPFPALVSAAAPAGIPAQILTASGPYPVRWLPVRDLEAARAADPAGIFFASSGEATDLATGSVHPIRRLPRVLLNRRQLLADNADASTSMASLLEDFTRNLRTQQDAPGFPHLCVATGYLYSGGLELLLRLLEIPGVQTLRLLFSGQTDLTTRRALLHRELGIAIDEIEPSSWTALHSAVQTGRLEVRVYADAFLHAKLYLAHDGRRDDEDRGGSVSGGIAVVGSSNVSSPGLVEGGNLELDVTLRDPAVLTSLVHWFDGRWQEAYPPDPELLSTPRPRWRLDRGWTPIIVDMDRRTPSLARLGRAGLANRDQQDHPLF